VAKEEKARHRHPHRLPLEVPTWANPVSNQVDANLCCDAPLPIAGAVLTAWADPEMLLEVDSPARKRQ